MSLPQNYHSLCASLEHVETVFSPTLRTPTTTTTLKTLTTTTPRIPTTTT